MPITPPIFLSQLDPIEKRGSRLIRWANLGGLSSHFIWNSVLAFFLPRCPIVLYYHLKMFLLPFHHKSTEFPLNNVSISRLRLQRWIPWAGYFFLVNLGKTLLRISRTRNIPLTRILAKVFVYLPPLISQILNLICWTVLIFDSIYLILYCLTLKTSNKLCLHIIC